MKNNLIAIITSTMMIVPQALSTENNMSEDSYLGQLSPQNATNIYNLTTEEYPDERVVGLLSFLKYHPEYAIRKYNLGKKEDSNRFDCYFFYNVQIPIEISSEEYKGTINRIGFCDIGQDGTIDEYGAFVIYRGLRNQVHGTPEWLMSVSYGYGIGELDTPKNKTMIHKFKKSPQFYTQSDGEVKEAKIQEVEPNKKAQKVKEVLIKHLTNWDINLFKLQRLRKKPKENNGVDTRRIVFPGIALNE